MKIFTSVLQANLILLLKDALRPLCKHSTEVAVVLLVVVFSGGLKSPYGWLGYL